GPFMWLIYAIALMYVAFGVIYFFRNTSILSELDRSATIVLVFIAILGIFIQGAFSINVELFFESIAFLGFMLFLEIPETKEAGSRSEKMSRSFIMVIALIFLSVIAVNINLIYHAGTDQSGRIGEVQINSLKGELQQTISDSQSYLLRYSLGLEQCMSESAGLDEIEQYIRQQKTYYSDLTGGVCFNAYAAAPDWSIFPDFDMPEDYHPVERVWYTGAMEHPGEVFISEPYIDADTGRLCYTLSNLLSDGVTVVGMDYKLERVQDIVVRMAGSADEHSMIVSDSGTIIGCSESACQGEELIKVMPQYAEAFERVRASSEHKSFKTKIDGDNKIVFSSETSNGWRLMLIVDYASFYEEIVDQMVLLGAIDLMMVAVIIVFYMISVNNQIRAERTLESTEKFITGLSEDLRGPMNEIMRLSDSYVRQGFDEEALLNIGMAGERLRQKMDNLFSYSSIFRSDISDENSSAKSRKKSSAASGRFIRNGIITILIVALLVGLGMCIGTAARWGSERVNREADRYDNEVNLWMQQKRSMVGMLADVIEADPTVLNDYDRAVKWLDDITKNYSELTFAYFADPYNNEHPIIMNNGWIPEDDFKVEERQWYIDTIKSSDGYSISAPYFDAQTGLYCITFSKSIYADNGAFIGVFAIDCLLDRLITVLDDSYTRDGYAFMVDQDGTIINHPHKVYEISEKNRVNIEDTGYADTYHRGSVFAIRDYDGRLVSCCAKKSVLSGFTVIVVRGWWSTYGNVLLVAIVFLVMIVISIIAITGLIRRFTDWQEETNKKLVEAADTAVAAERAKSRFLAQMSHEIRTPINAVLGMNEMILRESDDPSIRDYSGNIRSAGRNLLGLINSILDFSKIEEGKMEIVPVKYDTASMVESIVNSVSKRARDKGLTFTPHIDRELPSSLYGDDIRIIQIAVNLLTNAVKYTHEGSVDLFISGERLGDDRLMLRMSVKDTGIGIREEDIDKLFESFTRLDEIKNRDIEGTGLGMGIVNGLLKMMDSKLEVESVYGEGSEFSFEVVQRITDDSPIGDYEEKAKEALVVQDEDKYLYAPDARILVVDDNDLNLKVISNLLKLNGIAPDTVLSGKEALERMKASRYDVILLDHMMPHMDGIETLKKAREDNLIPEGCAVIALTANAVVGARETYLEAGFDDYLSKPVEIAAMESTLGKYLPKSKVSYKKRSEADAQGPGEAESFESGGSESLINTEDGIKFCAGDEDFYHEILGDYRDSYDKRTAELDEALKARDMDAYGISVHALKSISRTVGAAKVSQMAADLEKAAKAGDTETVEKGHKEMIGLFKETVEYISSMGIASTETPDEADDGVILEFMPDA
ncbi:MAG: response regulator, partial [Lachnospiraceae bacterium]|nr:response regulator [Lachnospiraceae bacterium]